MNGLDLIDSIATLLGESSRRLSTDSRFYSQESILAQINIAVKDTAKRLIQAEQRARVTIRKLSTQTTIPLGFGTVGVDVPNDFWFLECGVRGGKYVPAKTIARGERQVYFTNHDLIYTKSGKIFGNAEVVRYWKVPDQIQASNATINQFPDAFYEAVMFAASRDLVTQEDADVLERWKLFDTEFTTSASSLR